MDKDENKSKGCDICCKTCKRQTDTNLEENEIKLKEVGHGKLGHKCEASCGGIKIDIGKDGKPNEESKVAVQSKEEAKEAEKSKEVEKPVDNVPSEDCVEECEPGEKATDVKATDKKATEKKAVDKIKSDECAAEECEPDECAALDASALAASPTGEATKEGKAMTEGEATTKQEAPTDKAKIDEVAAPHGETASPEIITPHVDPLLSKEALDSEDVSRQQEEKSPPEEALAVKESLTDEGVPQIEKIAPSPSKEEGVAEDTPAKDTAEKDTPAEDSPAKDTPAEDTPGQDAAVAKEGQPPEDTTSPDESTKVDDTKGSGKRECSVKDPAMKKKVKCDDTTCKSQKDTCE